MAGSKLRSASKAVLILFVCAMHLVVYQNCGTYAASDSPLYSSGEASTCVGISCGVSLESAEIVLGNLDYYVKRVDGARPATCDESTCFDVAGYCSTGGYPDSVFYYELQHNTGAKLIPLTRTQASCDQLGRFRLQIRVPDNYDNSRLLLLLVMKVIDEEGNEHDGIGLNQKTASISTY